MKLIYLDYNATTPIDPEVAESMLPYLNEYFGNPSSSHRIGMQAKRAVEKARNQIADLLNCQTYKIVFTSCGTESNNYAIKGTAFANRSKGNHIITSTIEHPAVTEVCKYLETQGFEITYIPVDEFGMVEPKDIETAITSKTTLITIMHANNEVGTIQPIEEISEIARKRKIVFHTDSAQSIGKITTQVNKLGVDLLSIAGHKLYAPKGIGALYIREGIQLEKFMHGGNQEQDLRAGTENVLEIVGLGKACEIAKRDLEKNIQIMEQTRNKLQEKLFNELNDIKLNGHPKKRLPNTLNLSFKNLEADYILSSFKNVAASAGAACHATDITISPVLEAMNIPIEYAKGTIRFSTGKITTNEEIDQAVKSIVDVIR
ncbi:MAG: cysteine desulfurase, partial [Candidatus Cloacimonetes bacterium]|nr:cysteine desulfurase [Candidatus Cloacimonadota bacterium]